MKKKTTKKYGMSDCLDSIQNVVISYYINFGIYDLHFKPEQLFEIYNIALSNENKKNIDRKDFNDILRKIKDNALMTFTNKTNKEKLYVFVSFNREKNFYRFQMYDEELMDTHTFGDFTLEDFKKSVLNIIDPNDNSLNLGELNIEEINKNFIMVKNTPEEVVFTVRMEFEDIYSDICTYNYKLINSKLIRKYLVECSNQLMEFRVSKTKHILYIKYDMIAGSTDFLFVVKAIIDRS